MRRWLAVILAIGGLCHPGPAEGGTPTYHGDVERILQQHCQSCHRPGQIGPFPLLTYEQARKRAMDLARVVEARAMPPWPASTQEGGPFRGVRGLSEQEVATLRAWAKARAPEGDRTLAPPPRKWDSVWPLGRPDVVLSMPEPYALAGDGDDQSRVFVIPTGLSEGKWIAALDYRPGNPRVVHHVVAGVDTKRLARLLDRADPQPGYQMFGGFGVVPTRTLGGWSPGKLPLRAPDGTASYLPANADILLQVYYQKSGKPESDASVLGLYFAKAPVEKALRELRVTPSGPGAPNAPPLLIPAGKSNHEVTGGLKIDRDLHLLSVTPHMHWLGKDIRLRATRPDGKTQTLIRIDRWDFHWHGAYEFATPVALPKGTKVEMIAHFDNSAGNPFNPRNPPVDVRWGERTNDEMCVVGMSVTYDDERRSEPTPDRVRND